MPSQKCSEDLQGTGEQRRLGLALPCGSGWGGESGEGGQELDLRPAARCWVFQEGGVTGRPLFGYASDSPVLRRRRGSVSKHCGSQERGSATTRTDANPFSPYVAGRRGPVPPRLLGSPGPALPAVPPLSPCRPSTLGALGHRQVGGAR